MNQTPADPLAYLTVCTRDESGAVDGIVITGRNGAELVRVDGEQASDLIRLAREEEGTDPYSDTLPTQRAFAMAALRDLGIPILGEQDDDEWRMVPLRVMVNDSHPGETTLAGQFHDDNMWEEGTNERVIALARGEVDEVRLGGGAAPLVVLTRVGGTQDDIDAAAMERALFPAALPEAAKAPLSLLAAAKAVVEWEARMGGFEAPVWDALRAAIAQAEGASPAPVTAPEPITIGITLEGGLVQGVWSEQDAALRHVRLVVVDYDTEGADEDQVTREEPDCDGAILGFWSVEHAEGTADGPRLIRAAEVGGQS